MPENIQMQFLPIEHTLTLLSSQRIYFQAFESNADQKRSDDTNVI